MWGPVLLLDAGLTGQDGMGSLQASKFHWLLTLQHSLITVLSALAHGGPDSLLPTGLDSAHRGLGLLLMSAGPGSSRLQAGLLQTCFSIPMAGGWKQLGFLLLWSQKQPLVHPAPCK